MMAEEVAHRNPGDWRAANEGTVKLKQFPVAARLDLARLAWDAVRALAGDLIHVSGLRGSIVRSLKKTAATTRGRFPSQPT